MKLSERLVDWGYWLGWNALWALPAPVTRSLFDSAARLAWRMEVRGVRQLEMNLSRVLGCDINDPQIRVLSKSAMQSYMRYYWETFTLPRWSTTELTSKVRVENIEPVRDALKSGGVILTLPHTGNWDLAGAWTALELGSLCTVAERLRPEGVFQKFLKMRTERGITLMPLTGEGGTYEYLRDNLNKGKVVALLGDRDVAKNGMGNQFFGYRASLPIGAAVLALDTGRPLFTCCAWYDGDQTVITFDQEITVAANELTGRERLRKAQEVSGTIAHRFEEHIHSHPENWHQLQPVWSDLVAE